VVCCLVSWSSRFPCQLNNPPHRRPNQPAIPKPLQSSKPQLRLWGGATAIGEIQSWTLEGHLEGSVDNGDRTETIETWNGDTTIILNGSPKLLPRHDMMSPFVPALLGVILLKESLDPTYSIRSARVTTAGPKAVTAVTFSIDSAPLKATQTWYFDNTTGLPARIELGFPARIGRIQSFPGIVEISDWRIVSGVLYPFRIIMKVPNWSLFEMTTLQSVSTQVVALGGAQ